MSLSSLPSSVDKQTQHKLNEVRKEVFMGGMKGLAVGAVAGFMGVVLVRLIPSYKKKVTITHGIFGVIATMTFASYIGAVTHGTNANSHMMHFFHPSASPAAVSSSDVNVSKAVEEKFQSHSLPDKQTTADSPPQKRYGDFMVEKNKAVVEGHEEAFARRAEAIRKAKTGKEVETQPRW
eukprot:scaffold2798_cov160-Ochromonas_danica.AAC.21